MTVHTSTTQYEFTHGHKPRGNGNWAFDATVYAPGRGMTDQTVWARGTFTQAKRQAVAQLKATIGGITEISLAVCP